VTPRAGGGFTALVKRFVRSAAGQKVKREGMHPGLSEFVFHFLLAGKTMQEKWSGDLQGSSGEIRRLLGSLQVCRRQGNKRKGWHL